MIKKEFKISQVILPAESQELDTLLWEVLWKPLSFPRNIREKFTIEGKPLEFTAKHDGKLIGGLVAYQTAPTEVEIRHLAILKRKRPMGRDFYDAIFLFGKTNPNLEYLEKKTGISSMKNLKREIVLKCKDLSFKHLSADIKPYLFNPEGEGRYCFSQTTYAPFD
jgi:hypothetical protein